MKSLVVDAEWRPKKGYQLSEDEKTRKRARSGSHVWRNPQFDIKNKPIPNIEDDEVLIRVKACGICGSDTHLYETTRDGYIIFSGPVKLPCIIGHEYSGIVEKVGKKVINFKVGDKVAVESVLWCGKCTPCRSGSVNQCDRVELAGITVDGALAEFAKAKERHCWSINSLSEAYKKDELFNVGSLIEPAGCAYNGIFISGGGFKPGATVVVYGVGPIGLAAVALSRLAGAGIVIAFDVKKERLKIAKEMGADYIFDINDKGAGNMPSEKVKELTKGYGAEIQVEAAGAAPLTVPEMEKAMAVNGKIIYLGRAATSTPMFLDSLVSGANSIIGARGHAGYGIFHYIIKLLSRKRLMLDKMITSIYSFDKVMDAIAKSSKRTDGKIIIKVS